jgi:hypothetical protein
MPTQDEIELTRNVRATIDEIAASLGDGELGLVFHRSEDWAKPSRCFENAAEKARRDGGKVAYGWTFHLRHVEDMPGQSYVFITHHAVWHGPNGTLVNVTPYTDDKHYPLPAPGKDFVFAVDTKAKPVATKSGAAPLPLRFYPIGDDERLVVYVKKLNEEEQEKYRKLFKENG